jgi:hypothetical protein
MGMDISKTMKKNLKKNLKHHDVKKLEKDMQKMQKKHPEAERLGACNKDDASEENMLEKETDLHHWGLPRH